LKTGLATYPDVTVVCGATERDPESRTTVVNPQVVVEVTSDGTEGYDRGEKLTHYKLVPSLRAILIVSHREHRIDTWRRPDDSDTWTHASHGPGARVNLDAPAVELSVDEIYALAAEPEA
jgi:Uma2 family endonuclease